MDRRTVIKNLALIIGGAALLPACKHDDGITYYQLKHVNIDAGQQGLIADIAETIIPKTDVPGAKDLNLPAFVLKMVDDCYGKKDQQAFLAGLNEFTAMVKKKYDRSFSDLSVEDREAVLLGIENSNKPKAGAAKTPARRPHPQKNMAAAPLNSFYWIVKQQTIFGYTTSQFFMTKEIFYDMVPGRYHVHYPVSKLKLA